MKSKSNPFRSPAISGAAAVFACFSMLNSSAKAQAFYWTGNSGVDQVINTNANWVGGVAPGFSWSPIQTFDNRVVNGTVLVPFNFLNDSIVVASGCTTDITFNGAAGKAIYGSGNVTVDTAGKDLTFNVAMGNAGNDGLVKFHVGAARTVTVNGGIIGNDWEPGRIGSVVKDGTGAVVITSGSTQIGATILNQGSLTYANATAVGGAGSITVNNGGSLNFSSDNAGTTVTNAISLIGDGAGAAAFNVNTPGASMTFSGISLAGNALLRAVGNGTDINITNGITGTGNLAFAGFGGGGGTKNTLTLSGSSTYAGSLSIIPWYGSAQVTLSGGDDRLPTSGLIAVHGTAGGLQGVLNLNGNNQTAAGLSDGIPWGGLDAGARNIVNTSATPVTLTLNTTADQSSGVTIGGTDINGTTGNNLALVKTGSGTQTLTGTNTYSGTTEVNQGTLVVNGSISTSVTTVASGATLGGNGTVGTLTVDDGAFVTPGNSPGILTVNGNYTQAGTYNAEITGTTAGVGGYDQIGVTGAVNITGGSLVTLFSGAGYTSGALLFILLNNDSDAITGTYAGYAQGATVATYDGFDWVISYSANGNNVGSPSFTGGNDIALMAIPESNVAALIGGFGVLALLRRRR